MKMKDLFHILLIIFLTFYGCGQKKQEKGPDQNMKIRLFADSTGIELYNISHQITNQFILDSIKNEQWKNFFAVYEETTDQEMRDFQNALDGYYIIKDSLVEFIPLAGFKKGTSYFSRYYTRKLLQQPEDIISARDLAPTDGFIEFKFNIK